MILFSNCWISHGWIWSIKTVEAINVWCIIRNIRFCKNTPIENIDISFFSVLRVIHSKIEFICIRCDFRLTFFRVFNQIFVYVIEEKIIFTSSLNTNYHYYFYFFLINLRMVTLIISIQKGQSYTWQTSPRWRECNDAIVTNNSAKVGNASFSEASLQMNRH